MHSYLSGFSNKYHLEKKLQQGRNKLVPPSYIIIIIVLQQRLTFTLIIQPIRKRHFQLPLDTNHFNQFIPHIRDMADLMADQLCLTYEEYIDLLQLGTISGS